ncbi:MAG: IclR family transcriptional regulator C-terminal domain-containing protein [Roseiarcus sp.]|uniref:IclR family transcriptional regulator n=1 Tax=Roseiarcus sp. TaxID=1969460 RepID=UPI003BB03898
MSRPGQPAGPPRLYSRPRKGASSADAPPRSDSVQSLVRALGIINQLAETDEGMTLSRIAQRVDLAPSTVHRLLTTLEQERYVRFDADRRLWSVGVQTFVAGGAFLQSRSLIAVARPYMRALMEECGESVNLAIEDDCEAIYVHQVERRSTMRPPARAGARVPLHCSGVGKALLSAMSEKHLENALPGEGMPRLTANTIVSRSMLRDDVAQARERGFAVDDEEHVVGLRCVATPVFDEFGEAMAALSISGPTTCISPDRISHLADLARRKANEITARLGGFRPNWGSKSDPHTHG